MLITLDHLHLHSILTKFCTWETFWIHSRLLFLTFELKLGQWIFLIHDKRKWLWYIHGIQSSDFLKYSIHYLIHYSFTRTNKQICFSTKLKKMYFLNKCLKLMVWTWETLWTLFNLALKLSFLDLRPHWPYERPNFGHQIEFYSWAFLYLSYILHYCPALIFHLFPEISIVYFCSPLLICIP